VLLEVVDGGGVIVGVRVGVVVRVGLVLTGAHTDVADDAVPVLAVARLVTRPTLIPLPCQVLVLRRGGGVGPTWSVEVVAFDVFVCGRVALSAVVAAAAASTTIVFDVGRGGSEGLGELVAAVVVVGVKVEFEVVAVLRGRVGRGAETAQPAESLVVDGVLVEGGRGGGGVRHVILFAPPPPPTPQALRALAVSPEAEAAGPAVFGRAVQTGDESWGTGLVVVPLACYTGPRGLQVHHLLLGLGELGGRGLVGGGGHVVRVLLKVVVVERVVGQRVSFHTLWMAVLVRTKKVSER
jgi:hypothetical protein